MSGIGLGLSEEKTKLPTGASKVFGNPDVWEGFAWPQFSEGGEGYDLSFICQINCAEAAPFDTEGLLPESGMLYFFYDMDEMPKESVSAKASRLLYHDGDGAALFEMLRTDHEGNDMSLPELGICFAPPQGSGGPSHTLLGETFPNGWQPLLRIKAFDTDKLSLRFANKDALCFCVKADKLKSRDFSEVFVRQI